MAIPLRPAPRTGSSFGPIDIGPQMDLTPSAFAEESLLCGEGSGTRLPDGTLSGPACRRRCAAKLMDASTETQIKQRLLAGLVLVFVDHTVSERVCSGRLALVRVGPA